MSNTLNLSFTKFTNLDDKGQETDSTYGYRLYDDYAQVYCNRFLSKEELLQEVNENNFWEAVSQWEEFEDVDPLEDGMYFNGNWYDAEEIEEIKENVDE